MRFTYKIECDYRTVEGYEYTIPYEITTLAGNSRAAHDQLSHFLHDHEDKRSYMITLIREEEEGEVS